jgi:hypothetical protein
MDGTCNTCGRQRECKQKFHRKTLKRRDHLEVRGMYARIILRCISNKGCVCWGERMLVWIFHLTWNLGSVEDFYEHSSEL